MPWPLRLCALPLFVVLAASPVRADPGAYAEDGKPMVGAVWLTPDEPWPATPIEVRARPESDAPMLYAGPGVTVRTDEIGSLELQPFVKTLRIGAEEWLVSVFEKKGDWVRVETVEPARTGWLRLRGSASFVPLSEIFANRLGYFTTDNRQLFVNPGSDEKARPASHAITFAGLVRAPPMPSPMPRDAALPRPGLVRVFARPDESTEPLHHFARSNTESWIASYQDGEHLFDRAIPIFQKRGRWLQAAIPHEDAMSFPLRREKYRDVGSESDGTRRVWLLADEVEPLQSITSDEALTQAREAVLDRYVRDAHPEVTLGEIRDVGGRWWIQVKTSAMPSNGDPTRDFVPLAEGWLPLIDEAGKFSVWFYVSAC